ncbi:hypothetical protein OM076_23690 [Solirubrobacter ginsenosidimutans]|uniref:Ig-like domain-containing protein n=1 Tax=Solirubrobacter ginsenosidimutans TaxID=490573 RepID=A0A9X3N1S9_9ACTN|nr:hypothetical protein [Solirubrobacter ginsenosidimutans]MDA0163298.1 hypothetical protein [Solirubrobacter ginsenosidimutans]
MRRLLALAVFAVLAAAPASARASDVMLWACHGPDGRPLPVSYDASQSAGASVTLTSSQPCQTAADTIRLGFQNTSPPEGSYASLRFTPPVGSTAIEGVWIGRRVTGPGYFARTSNSDLESLDGAGTLDGVFNKTVGGSWVELGVRCATAGCDMTGSAVEFRFLALQVRDDLRPVFDVAQIPSYAAGVVNILIDARDGGIGLATATATLGGVPMASVGFGQAFCSELSPGDTTIDLPLNDDCPTAKRITLPLDSTLVPDGTHKLEVTVTDGAGNASVRSYDLKVVNHPPVTVTPTPVPTRIPTPSPTPTATPTASPGPAGTAGTLKAAKRYTVSKAGSLAAEASCPALARSSCRVSLKLTATLPGAKKAVTIASARGTVKPGAKAKLKLKLSLTARRALTKRHSLTAQLTLAGAKPVKVKLIR